MPKTYTVQDFGPNDLLDSNVIGDRRVKTNSFLSTPENQDGDSPLLVTRASPLPIEIIDVAHDIVDQYAYQDTTTSTTLAADTSANDISILVADSTGFVTGDYFLLNTTIEEPTKPQITSVVGNTLNLDRRLDRLHTTGDTVTKVIIDMAATGQIGTMSNPQEYRIQPPVGEIWYLFKLIFTMVHGTAGDLGLFGNLEPLINGVLLRIRINGQYTTYSNWKTNSDFNGDGFTVEFNTRSSGGGSYGTSGSNTIEGIGSVIRLDGNTNDSVEMYVQDDITALDLFTMKFQGHKDTV